MSEKIYDVLVIGGGHAGCEAALAAARLGKSTCMITGSLDRIASMSCNPAIGGVGKGHLVREIDALGGEMSRVADATGLHFRTLNESRGPAVRATRCQSDMHRYALHMSTIVHNQQGLALKQDDVTSLLVSEEGEQKRVVGVRTKLGVEYRAHKTIITTGTFLGGKLHRGKDTQPGGRAGEAPASGLSQSLTALGLRLSRLKTGTCPRLDARTIDFSGLEEQTPDVPAPMFSIESSEPPLPQHSCFMTKTNPQTHAVIQRAVDEGDAPVFNGQIDGNGPRYCPSIEDKVVRFADKQSHLIFLEPHGLDTHEIYPNGISTSLPPEDQIAFLRTIKGLEKVEVTRWGYAVEYDFVDPTQLRPTLEVRDVPDLYTAGQINGTTGYEEAAIQGLLAGINAVLALDEKEPLVLLRHEAYLGVLVDDLTTRGTEEPYRMFTSRAEHRLILREDNAHARLKKHAERVGLISKERLAKVNAFEGAVAKEMAFLLSTKVLANDRTNAILERVKSAPIRETQSLEKLLKRPEVDAQIASELCEREEEVALAVRLRAATEVKYAGYIERAQKAIERDKELEDAVIPDALFAERLPGMSSEVHEKLLRVRPRTLGQASRISGVTPAAIGLIAVELRKRAS